MSDLNFIIGPFQLKQCSITFDVIFKVKYCNLLLRFELPVIIHNSLTDKWPLSAASDLRGSRLPLFCLAKLPNESLKAQIHINKP